MEPPSKAQRVLAQPGVRTWEPSDREPLNHIRKRSISLFFFQIFCLLVQISLSVSGQKREEYLAHVEPGISADTN